MKATIGKLVGVLISTGLSLGVPSISLAEVQKPSITSSREIMAANHRKAAEMHAKMAACLASADKTIEQCRSEMVATCSSSFGGNCPMGSGAGMMRGSGRGMMNGSGESCMSWFYSPGSESGDKQPAK